MAIERVDIERPSVDEDLGWCWQAFNNDIEELVIYEDEWLKFNVEGDHKHLLHKSEIGNWIKALTKAQKYFDDLEET